MLVGSEKIEKDVQERLKWDSRIKDSKIKVSVYDREVVLTGFVPTYCARQAAQMDASVVPGVRTILNNILVRYVQEITDEELTLRVRNILDWSADVNASGISISVKAGTVYLQGTVNTYWEKMKAEEIVSNLQGVTVIDNRIVVNPVYKYEDVTITENIINALDKNVYIDPHMVKVFVKVESGEVQLSGSVPTWAAYKAILDIAFFTPGVVDVTANLNIITT
jgi:osmotically-inducible protein OsmY